MSATGKGDLLMGQLTPQTSLVPATGKGDLIDGPTYPTDELSASDWGEDSKPNRHVRISGWPRLDHEPFERPSI